VNDEKQLPPAEAIRVKMRYRSFESFKKRSARLDRGFGLSGSNFSN
jgi:hypothetical protein